MTATWYVTHTSQSLITDSFRFALLINTAGICLAAPLLGHLMDKLNPYAFFLASGFLLPATYIFLGPAPFLQVGACSSTCSSPIIVMVFHRSISAVHFKLISSPLIPSFSGSDSPLQSSAMWRVGSNWGNGSHWLLPCPSHNVRRLQGDYN